MPRMHPEKKRQETMRTKNRTSVNSNRDAITVRAEPKNLRIHLNNVRYPCAVVDHRNTAVLLLLTQEVFDGLDSAGYCDCLRSSRHDEHEALGGLFKVRSVGGGDLLLCPEYHRLDLRGQPAGCERSLRGVVGDGHGTCGNDRALVLQGVVDYHQADSARVYHRRGCDVAPYQRVTLMKGQHCINRP